MVSDYELPTRHKCNDTHLSSHTLITDTEHRVTLLQPRHPPAASAWWCGRWWPHSSDSWRCVYRGLAPAACSPCLLHLIMAASGIEDNFVKTLHLWWLYLIGRGNAIEPKLVKRQNLVYTVLPSSTSQWSLLPWSPGPSAKVRRHSWALPRGGRAAIPTHKYYRHRHHHKPNKYNPTFHKTKYHTFATLLQHYGHCLGHKIELMKKHNNVTLKRRSKSETYRFVLFTQAWAEDWRRARHWFRLRLSLLLD